MPCKMAAKELIESDCKWYEPTTFIIRKILNGSRDNTSPILIQNIVQYHQSLWMHKSSR